MDRPKVIIFTPGQLTMIKGLALVARANLIVQHNKINSIKVMDCPERGLLCWPPSGVRLSAESRMAILDAVKERGLAP